MKKLSAILMAKASLLIFCGETTANDLQFTDADGKLWTLNLKERITVVIGNTDQSASQARAAGRTLYPFQGREDFRAVVVVGLDKSIARHARNITLHRIRRDLDAEAKRIAPYYRDKSNPADPRQHIGAIADFDGSVAKALGWHDRHTDLRIIIFGKNGTEAARFDPAKDLDEVRCKVAELLKIPCPDEPSATRSIQRARRG